MVVFNGGDFVFFEVEYENVGIIDVIEKIYVVYLMVNYDIEMWGKFVCGNFGVCVVDIEVIVIGFRSFFDVVYDDLGVVSLVIGDLLECIEGGGGYIEVLFSVNFVMDYSDDILLCVGIYCGMFCVDLSDLGYSWIF